MADAVIDVDQTLYTFAKSANEVVTAAVQEFRGHCYGNLRVCVRGTDGALRPTVKGLTLRAELLPELERAVTAMRTAAPLPPVWKA